MSTLSQIADLARKLGLGNYPNDGVKAILGKMPINLSESRAKEVLDALQKRYDATPAGRAEKEESLGWCEDVPMAPGYRARRR